MVDVTPLPRKFQFVPTFLRVVTKSSRFHSDNLSRINRTFAPGGKSVGSISLGNFISILAPVSIITPATAFAFLPPRSPSKPKSPSSADTGMADGTPTRPSPNSAGSRLTRHPSMLRPSTCANGRRTRFLPVIPELAWFVIAILHVVFLVAAPSVVVVVAVAMTDLDGPPN